MKIGDIYPVGKIILESNICERVEAFDITGLHGHRIVKTRKGHICCKCFKNIKPREDCFFANVVLKRHQYHCPTMFENLWWHIECNDASYEEILRNAEDQRVYT